VGATAALAGASLHVYLTHFQTLRVVEGPLVETVLSVAVGLLCARLATGAAGLPRRARLKVRDAPSEM
jgi:hypothetical protein